MGWRERGIGWKGSEIGTWGSNELPFLNRMVRVDLEEKVTIKQRLERSKEVSHPEIL